MFEPGTTVDLDGNAGRGGRLPAAIQSGETAQPAGLRKPGGFCGAELSIPSSGRATPSLRRGWTRNKQKHKLNQVPGLTHGLAQKSEPGHSIAIVAAATPGRTYLVDWTSGNHNGAAGISFADGHVIIHKWQDARTYTPPPPLQEGQGGSG